MQLVLDVFLHLKDHLNDVIVWSGPWVYLVFFLVIFCETGLVVTPFLPGDSFLFAIGAIAAIDNSPISLPLVLGLLIVAAITGDAVNYFIGYWVGPKVFKYEHSRLLNKKHLIRTQEFYERYGGKTIILARFIPIIRTFAPFVAGIGRMEYRHFSVFNITGGVAWVSLCLAAGYYFGELDFVKKNFELVIVAIVLLSVMPAFLEFWLARRRRLTTVPVSVEAPVSKLVPAAEEQKVPD